MAAKSQHSATIEPNLVELPPCIEIKDSSVNSGVPGAFSKMLIPQDTRFGPYKGEIIIPGQKAFIDYRFAWEVFEKNSNVLKHTINAMDSRSSNWMRHVNNARFYEEQNIISTQDGYSIYYVAMKDIKPGEELLTWFDPKLLKRTKRRLSKMARKPVGYTIELVPWSDEKKFVPEIIETKRARKKKVLSDMISLDENPLILTRTLQRLSKLPCTPKQLAQSGFRGTATSEHKNIGLEASKSTSFGSTYIFPTSKTTSMHKGPVIVKGSPAKKDHGSFHILGHSSKSMHHDPNRGRMVPSNNSVCFTLGNARSEKGNAQLSAPNITGSFLKIKKMKGKGNVELRKSPIRIGKFNHQNVLGGGVLVYEDFTAIKPIVFTPNSDGSTSVEDHDETFILGNMELMPECDEKCFCLVDKTPTSSIEAKQGNFVIQFTLLPEHKSISPDNKIIFRCDICDSAYNHAFSLKRHYLRVHVNHRYLSREDIVNCQIETFHTNFEMESRDSKIETLASSEENIKVGEQLSIPKIRWLDLDQISTDTPISCNDKLKGESTIQDNSLMGEVPICRDGNKETFDSEVNAMESSSELTAVPSLSNLAQASLDKVKAAHTALDIPSKLSTTACEQIKHHSSVADNGSQLMGDESLTSDQKPSLGLETLSAQPENDNLIANISLDGHTETDTVNDLIQHSLKPDLMAAALHESVASQSMADVCNSMKKHDEHSSASAAESVPQSASCVEVQAATIDTNCSAEISETRPLINPDASEKWCSSDSSFTEEISLVSAEPYAESATSTSYLFKLSPDEFDHNRLVEETNEASENSSDQVCQTLSADSILDENIDQNNFEEERICSPLDDTDMVPCSSTESLKNDAEDFLEEIEACSATSLTESSPADSNNGISVENDTDGSGIKVDASYTISDVDFLNSESITSPMEMSQSLQEEVSTQMLTSTEPTDCDHSGINAVTPVALFVNENNRDNLSDLAMGSYGSLSPFINQLSPLTCDAEAPTVYKNLQLSPDSSGALEISKKYETDISLPKTSGLQNTAAFPVSTLENSTTPSITSTSSVTTQNQPPQQLIFVTNLVFPVVSPGQKQIPNSMTPLSLAVSQSSSPTTSQTTMPGLTTSVPLVVISQVPCGLSVQNAANAFLQSSSALKTLQSIKHSLNVLNLGNTAPGLRSLLPSSNKSSIATVACGNSALINSLSSAKNSTAVTSSPIYSSSSKSEHISGNPLKPGTILNYSSPHTAVSSLVYGLQPISSVRSTKSVTVVKTLTPTMSSFIAPQRTQTHSGAQPDDLYRCHMCVLLFKTMSELKFHIRNDPHRFKGGIKQYACLQCSMRFSNKNNLMRHNLMNHPENENFKFRCYTCGKGFMSETYLKMHARFHSGKNFPCKYGCVDKFFPNAASLVKHLRAQHAGLDLKEYLRNEKASRKKVSGMFTVTNGQISSLRTEEKTALVTNKPVITSLVQYSLSQPGIGFQAKRGHSKGSKHPSNDFSELFSKVEDKFGNTKELEFLSKVSDSLMDKEQNNNLRYECHLCLQRLSSHLKLLQHRTQKHGINQSVQEYLYQMSKETVDEVSETERVKLEFSPPPSPKTFFENVNRRGYENMNHYIDGSKESLDLWQKHLIGQESVTKCEQMPSSKEKLEWTMFNFPLCFEYKEDCTIFYDRITELDGDHKLCSEPEGGKEKGRLSAMCDVSEVKTDAEKKKLDVMCEVSEVKMDTENKTLDAMCDVSGVKIDAENTPLDVVCDVSGINIDTEKKTLDTMCDVSEVKIDTEKNTLDVMCEVSGINIDTEMHTVDEALECMERTSEELFNECTNDVYAIDRQEFSEKNITDSCEESLCVDSKSHDKLTSENQKTITREVENNSDTVVDVDNCKVIDKTMIVTEELSKNIVYSYDDLVETNESNLDCSIAGDYVIKSGASIHTSSEETSKTTSREIQCLCRCIVHEIVDSAVMASKSVMEMEHNLHEVQSVYCENNEVKTFPSEGVDGPLERSGDSVLDSDVVLNTLDAKVDENMEDNNLVTALDKAPITCEALSKTKLNQQQFTNLSAEEKCQVLKGHSVQGIDLAISRLHHMISLSDRTLRKEKIFLDRMHPSSVFLLDALDLHIAEKPLSSKLFKKILCSKMKNASSFMSSFDKTMSIGPPMVSSESKMSYAHFDHAEYASLNTSDASKHDHKRYSIWAGQVQQSFHKANKEETFCQPVTEAVRKQELMRQQVKYQFDKSERYKEIDHKSEAALKMNFAEELGLMSKKEFDLSYHTKKQQEFVIKVPEIWDNYENIWFGKKGNITVVCSICHRHFSCWDLCFRHQLKKHPHIEPASLEMERDNYVEDMYYYYPMPYGILAQTHLIPDNLQALEVYVCTKCGFPFKNLSRLHAHIIVCGPAQEGITSSQNGHLKKPSYMKKKLLPIMDRRLYQNLEPPKAKVRQTVKNVVYARSPSAETKHNASSLAQEKGNKLSLTPDSKLSSSSPQSRSNYSAPFSFYSGRKRKTYELLYNPQNHTRRREMYKVLEQHQCHGCNLKFNSLYMLEKHVNKCDGRDKLQSQKPLLSGIMPDDAAVRKQHTCRYCSKRFTHIKGVDLHYKRICAVRKVKEEENQLTAEDLAHETELLRIIEHIKWSKSLNKDSSDIIQGNVIVEEDGTLTRVVKQQGSPQGLKKKVKKKTSKWTTLKRHRLDEDMSTPSSSTQSSPVIPAEGDMKLSEQVGGILGVSGQKRLTRSMSHEVVNKKPVATKRQISAGGGSVRNKDKTVSPSSSTGTGNSRTTASTSTHSKKKSKAKKSSSSKVNTSGNVQNKSHSKSIRDSRENTSEACSSSGTSLKPCKEAAPTSNPSACIKPPARKRGKPQKFDPSDMESSYKKSKKSDQVYTFSQKKPDNARNDFNERKRSRSEASCEESSQKKQKTEVTVKVCESYLLRNKSPRVVLERTTAPYTGVSKCDLSRKDDKPDSKKIPNRESSKLVVKMKQFTETTKSKRSKLPEVTKPSSSLAHGDMLNNKERKIICSSKKFSVDNKKCKSIGKVPSSELLKHLTEGDETLTLNKPSQKSVAKRKKPSSGTPLQAQSLAALKDKCASSKLLKITTLKSGGKTSASTSSPVSKAPMNITSNSPVISGLRTLAKTTLGKATLRLEGGESRNNVIKSSLVTLPVMSPCSVVTSASSVTFSSQSCKGILSKPTSPVFKQSTAPVRIVTLSPNGNNLLTYDSPEDVPQSSLLLPKSTNAVHVSLPSPAVSLSPRTVLVSTKSAVNVQPKEFLKIIHDPNREKHAAPISESSGFIHIGHGQTKSTIRMKESVIHVTSHSSASPKGPLSPVSDRLNKLGQASQEGEQEDMVYSIEQLKSDSKSEDELVGKEAVGNCPTNNYSVILKNVSVPAILNSPESISTNCSEEKTPKLSVKRSLNLSLENEIIPQGITEQVYRKEPCTTSKAVDKTPDKQNQIIANCIPRVSTAQHITYCQNGQNIVQQKAKLIHSVNSLGFLSSHSTPTQSTCQPKFRVTSASTKSHEAVSAIIIPSTAIKTQVTVPRATSSTSASTLTFPTRFGSPAKIITVTGGAIPTLIQGGTVQTGNRILKLGSPRSFMAPTQTTSIRAGCQQIPSAAASSSSSHTAGGTLTKMVLPLSAALLPKIVTTGIRQHHPQPAASKIAGVHSLLNIAANQTNATTHLISRPPAQQLCWPQSTNINNIVTVPQPSGLASIVSASSIKTNQPPKTISAVPFSKPAANQIMFSLDDGTTAMLDPDSLAQLLSISPSLNKTEFCSSPSVVNGVSVDKSTGLLDVTEGQLSESGGDAITWPSNGTVDLTELSDSAHFE